MGWEWNFPVQLIYPSTYPQSSFCFRRKVFFTDYGQIPKVERCDMDGQNRTKLVDSKIVFPHGITLDLVSRLVYWADAYLDYIEVVDYEGKNRHTIIQGLLVRTSSIIRMIISFQCAVLVYALHNSLKTLVCSRVPSISIMHLMFLLCAPVMCSCAVSNERRGDGGHFPFH